jgi:glutaredoxin
MSFRNDTVLHAAVCLIALTTTMASAETIYKIVGADGKITYSSAAPPTGHKSTALRMDVAAPEASGASNASIERKQEAQAKQQKPSDTRVAELEKSKAVFGRPTFFFGKSCRDCDAARSFMDERGIVYRDIDVDTVDGRRARNEVGGGREIPLLLFNGERISGFDVPKYESLFSKKRS